MGGQPCFYKQLMNGARTSGNAKVLTKLMELAGSNVPEEAAYEIIELLNTAEDSIDKASALFLDAVKYDGPVNHALDFKEDYPSK